LRAGGGVYGRSADGGGKEVLILGSLMVSRLCNFESRTADECGELLLRNYPR